MRTPLIVKSLASIWISNSFVKLKNFNTNEDKSYSSKVFYWFSPQSKDNCFLGNLQGVLLYVKTL
jgi:hypothetical protein